MAYINVNNLETTLNKIYYGAVKYKLRIYVNGTELEDVDNYCEGMTIKHRIIPNGSKVFSLNSLISKEVELVLHDLDLSILNGKINIGLEIPIDDSSNEYVPIGQFNIEDKPTNDKDKTTFTLRDNSVLLDHPYNAQPLIEENNGTVTKLQIFQDICTKFNIETDIEHFDNEDDELSIYDNTVNARIYICDIAEQAGCIASFDRYGKLIFVELDDLYTWTLPFNLLEKYENGDSYKISRLVYEDAIRKYEVGDNTYDTLYLDSANPYISSQKQVEAIFDKVQNFEINSIKTGKIIGNPLIDGYDLITFTDDVKEETFTTLASYELIYSGVLTNTFDTQIGIEERQENVTLTGEPSFRRYAKTNIDNINNNIELLTVEQNETSQRLTQTIQNVNSIQSLFQITGGSNLIKNSQGLLDDDVWNFPSENKTETLTGHEFEINGIGKDSISLSKLYGDTFQQTYSGKNLLNIPNGTYTSGNNTISIQNNIVTPNFTTVSSVTGFYVNLEEFTLLAGTYTLNNFTTNHYPYVQLQTNNNGSYSNVIATDYNANGKKTVTLTESKTISRMVLYFGSTTQNYEQMKIQLESGNGTDTFEPFVGSTSSQITPSPNPDYPQEIQSVTGRQVVSVEGKNLFNYNSYIQGYFERNQNITNGVVNRNCIFYIPCEANTTYTFKVQTQNVQQIIIANTSTTPAYGVSTSNGENINLVTLTTGYTYTTNSTAQYIVIRVQIASGYSFNYTTPNFTDFIYETQLEKGNQATSYEPYQGPKEYEINLGKNLFDKDNYTLLNHVYINVEGSSPNFTYQYKVDSLHTYYGTFVWKIKPNTTYTISKIITKRFAVGTSPNIPTHDEYLTNGSQQNNASSITITSGANDNYLTVWFMRTDLDTTLTIQEVIDSLQIEVGNQATSFSPYFTPIELNKIGDYQDYIDGDVDNWYVNSYVGKVVLDGNENNLTFNSERNGIYNYQLTTDNAKYYSSNNECLSIETLSNYFNANIGSQWYNNLLPFISLISNKRILIGTNFSTINEFKTWLSTHNIEVLYVLNEPTRTKITNTELVSQLNALANKQLPKQTNYITLTSNDIETEMDLKVVMKTEFVKGYDASLIGTTVANAKLGLSQGIMSTKEENINNLLYGVRYTLNFYITNEEDTTTTIRLRGLNTIYEKTFTEPCEMQQEVIEFIADTSNYVFEVETESTYDGWVYIYDLMLNSGDVKKWEPALGELSSTVIRMSQLGIRVSCTGSNVAALLTAQGFQVRRFQNGEIYEIITEFTDKGILTKKITYIEDNMDGLIHKTMQSNGYKKYITYIGGES